VHFVAVSGWSSAAPSWPALVSSFQQWPVTQHLHICHIFGYLHLELVFQKLILIGSQVIYLHSSNLGIAHDSQHNLLI